MAAVVSQTLVAEAMALAPEQRIELISVLWGSVDHDVIPPTEAEILSAQRRLREYRADPTAVVSEEEVFAKIDALIG
jgi:putative addiction module component (TIGR02574 family)